MLFLAGGPDQQVAAVILADDLALDRLEAVHRFWAALTGDKVPPERRRMSRQKRQRAGKSLRAVDGRKDGASYRLIAEALFPAHRITLATWKSNALRETVIRLARDGLQLVAGGYRALLHRKRHSRKRKKQAVRTG
ncbi:DUF2285 domain-containing protein [Paracoccus versutus]|nr:DUF2285 domain-containing protein [Paracoccus versutus]